MPIFNQRSNAHSNATAFCAKCEKVLLEDYEIKPEEEQEENSICCDECGCWFHYRCQNMKLSDYELETEWLCSHCLESFASAEIDHI